MSKTKWHKGAPPSIGWWPASRVQKKNAIRWWNGKCWSEAAFTHDNAEQANHRASWAAFEPGNIEWSERWWL